MTYDRFDLFEAYTNQTLPDAERKALEEQLRIDNDLKTELLDYQRFKHSIDAVNVKAQLERIHNRLDRQGAFETTGRPPQPLNPTLRLRRQRLFWPMLAVLLLVGGIYWFTRPSLAEQTFVTYYQPEPVSRGEATCSSNLMSGIQAYRAGRYEDALNQFSRLPTNQPCVAYYVGVSQLALNQGKSAINTFETSLKSDVVSPPLVRQKAEWYLALAYLKTNQLAEAKHQLVRITQQPDQPFRNVAQKALADLQND